MSRKVLRLSRKTHPCPGTRRAKMSTPATNSSKVTTPHASWCLVHAYAIFEGGHNMTARFAETVEPPWQRA
eukprot:1965746-Prymnesium_polylepis.2